MKRPALQNKQVLVLRMAFWARKVLGTFEKRAPGLWASVSSQVINSHFNLTTRAMFASNVAKPNCTRSPSGYKAQFNILTKWVISLEELTGKKKEIRKVWEEEGKICAL